MDVQRWTIVQERFDCLVEMPPAERLCALQKLDAVDPELAKELRELLEEDILNAQLPEMNVERLLQDALTRDDTPWPPQSQIGPYRLIKLLGEGGMGVVYLAERTDIAGYVAIKLLRDAWLSPVRRQRFAIEQQMLGLLKHLSIARIYDAGTTEDGTPWFVMEFSDGVSITDYLRERKATLRETLTLLVAVCEAVRYAHSLAIIHRDLKPSNILVTADGQVKLLDFGIAKQMDLIDHSGAFTTAGFRLFTPAYAAPELQSENRVGVFTDIYSIGVILYEVMTGSLPFPRESSTGLDPQRPSKVHAVNAGTQPLASKNEWTDIDAICMKALDKDAENRYRSVDALMDDLNALLENRPVSARKNAFVYTAAKFLSRNRVPVVSIALVLLIAIAGVVLFTVRLAKARDAAARSRDEAIAEATRSAHLQHFTESLFTGGASYGIPPPGIKIIQMLDRGRSEANHMTEDRVLQANMFQTLGDSYRRLGRISDAEPLLRKAQQVICTSPQSIQCADVKLSLGLAIGEHASLTESIGLIKDALRIKQEKVPPDDASLVDPMLDLAAKVSQAGDEAQSQDLLRQALMIALVPAQPTPQLAGALDQFARMDLPYNDPRRLEYEERSARINEQFYGKNSYEHSMNELALAEHFRNFGKYDLAEQHYRSALAEVQAWSGTDEDATVPYLRS